MARRRRQEEASHQHTEERAKGGSTNKDDTPNSRGERDSPREEKRSDPIDPMTVTSSSSSCLPLSSSSSSIRPSSHPAGLPSAIQSSRGLASSSSSSSCSTRSGPQPWPLPSRDRLNKTPGQDERSSSGEGEMKKNAVTKHASSSSLIRETAEKILTKARVKELCLTPTTPTTRGDEKKEKKTEGIASDEAERGDGNTKDGKEVSTGNAEKNEEFPFSSLSSPSPVYSRETLATAAELRTAAQRRHLKEQESSSSSRSNNASTSGSSFPLTSPTPSQEASYPSEARSTSLSTAFLNASRDTSLSSSSVRRPLHHSVSPSPRQSSIDPRLGETGRSGDGRGRSVGRRGENVVMMNGLLVRLTGGRNSSTEGSRTTVEEGSVSTDWIPQLYQQTSKPTAILRLRVDEKTGEVTTLPGENEEEEEEARESHRDFAETETNDRRRRRRDQRLQDDDDSSPSLCPVSSSSISTAASEVEQEPLLASRDSHHRPSSSSSYPPRTAPSTYHHRLTHPPPRRPAFPASRASVFPGSVSNSSTVDTLERFRFSSLSTSDNRGGGERVIQHEDYVETVTRTEDTAFSCGEKKANDGSWREKWMQQTVEEEDDEEEEEETSVQKGQEEEKGGTSRRAHGEEATRGRTIFRGRRSPGGARMRRRTFGQNHGVNHATRERWSERWEEVEGRHRTVEKAVQQLDEEGVVIQEWCEVREEDLRSGETTITKAGEDYRESLQADSLSRTSSSSKIERRRGGESTEEEREGEGEDTVRRGLLRDFSSSTTTSRAGCRRWKEENKLRVDVKTGEEVEKTEAFEEIRGGRTRGRRRRYDHHTRMEETEEWSTVMDSDTGELKEKWQERWFQNGEGATWGEKQGVNTLGEEWGEKWRSSASSSGVEREVDRWARTRDGRKRWGEKTGSARVKKSGAETTDKQGDEKERETSQEEEANGLLSEDDKNATTLEEYTERWEVEHGDETYTTFTDRWWSRPEEGSRWGEKKRVVHTRLRRKSEEEELNSNSTSHVVSDKVEEFNEKWYDNGGEKMIDKWRTETLLEEPGPDLEASQPPRRILVEIRSGEKHGDRYSDGTQWGCSWHESRSGGSETEAKGSSSHTTSSEEEEKINEKEQENGDGAQATRQVQVQVRTPDGRYQVLTLHAAAPSLRLTSRSEDKWWREPHGNTWGEKMYGESLLFFFLFTVLSLFLLSLSHSCSLPTSFLDI
ncbi:at hook motif protein [Cystoisospora suis]|uniref:At hook motif protein n=1 Tax=Cystoisospora suis TaxID=483139 RepID=A0A2C6JEP0_9APIC|nr:at hook motif protein [Cystoisospora suis]